MHTAKISLTSEDNPDWLRLRYLRLPTVLEVLSTDPESKRTQREAEKASQKSISDQEGQKEQQGLDGEHASGIGKSSENGQKKY